MQFYKEITEATRLPGIGALPEMKVNKHVLKFRHRKCNNCFSVDRPQSIRRRVHKYNIGKYVHGQKGG